MVVIDRPLDSVPCVPAREGWFSGLCAEEENIETLRRKAGTPVLDVRGETPDRVVCGFLFMFISVLCVCGAGWALAATPEIRPEGELKQRIELTQHRMVSGETPAFTPDFVLADVALKPEYPRRFSEYSGDLSGRYIGALALMPTAGKSANFDALVTALLPYQRPDGRFGNASIEFSAAAIKMEHMALLWGNGRLLVGLLEYQAANPKPEVLETAKKLGDFLCSVRAECAKPDAIERVKNLGAAGTICFTQSIEGLVMLAQAANEPRYLGEAAAIAGSFDTRRGEQHSHGYLTTLRGILMLYEATKEAKWLDTVRECYAQLVASPDLQAYGGVQEFFGGKGVRDEGCSEADFLRLSLQLWRVTGEAEYLNRAEHILVNQFYVSQFATGDFGHHVYFHRGLAPFQGVGRAWWCCTMHGLRAFRDVLDLSVTEQDGLLRVNLFSDLNWKGDGNEASFLFDGQFYKISVKQTGAAGVRIALRCPPWGRLHCSRPAQEKDGYLVLDSPLRQGESAEIAFKYDARILFDDGKTITPEFLTDSPIEGILLYGPWIMGVDEQDDPQFFGEPWDENIVYLPAQVGVPGDAVSSPGIHKPNQAIACGYRHGGFPDLEKTALTPIGQITLRRDQTTFAARLRFQRQP